MLLSSARSKARHVTSQEKAPVAAPPPPSTKKQRSIHDFFAQCVFSHVLLYVHCVCVQPVVTHLSISCIRRDIVRETTRKKREPAAATRLSSADVAPVTKRIDYDSSSSGMDDDESSEDPSVASQASEQLSLPKPKKIDFGSQRSEPDGEPNEIHAGAARSVVSSQQFLDNLSAPPFERLHSFSSYSQDDMDFLTPMDQPVLPLSHPTTPSPLKKRQRRNEAGDFVDRIREEEVQNLTQDLTHMDVCRRLGVQPPPSFSSDSMPSPRHFLPPSTPLALADTPVRSFLPSKRRSRPDRYDDDRHCQ